MLLEIKTMFTAFSVLLLVVIMYLFAPIMDFFILMIFMMVIMIQIFGDVVHGYFCSKTKAVYWIDKPPENHVTDLVLNNDGYLDIVYAKKDAQGKREFVYNGKEASVIDHGKYPIHFPNGSIGFLCHEKCGHALDLRKVKYAEKKANQFGTNNIKEMYGVAKEVDRLLKEKDKLERYKPKS
jgi:hypothetical protein